MTPFVAATISKDRLRGWQRRNEREQLPCTPVVLVNVSHPSGQIVLNTTGELPLSDVRLLLLETLKLLDAQITKQS